MDTTTYDFTYEYRQAHRDSAETRICQRLLDDLFCQTALVDEALRNGFFSYDDIANLYDGDDAKEIFQWAAYDANDWDRQRFDKAGIPYLHNDYGTWIGLTSFGTSWEVYVVAELAGALYSD